jgi:hypothetical protein
MRMLWVIWLRAGPTIELMRKYLLSVRVMVSDMGVEIGIPDVVDHLPAFFDWIQGKDLTPSIPGSYLFPLALTVGGWNHAWDLIERDSYHNIAWFAEFLSQLKVITHFFKSNSYNETVQMFFERSARPDLALAVKLCHVTFANWRWGTFHKATSRVNDVSFLREHWPLISKLLAHCHDGARVKLLGEIVVNQVFWKRLAHMTSVSSKANEIRKWGLRLSMILWSGWCDLTWDPWPGCHTGVC